MTDVPEPNRYDLGHRKLGSLSYDLVGVVKAGPR